MIISLKWLKDYINLDGISTEEIVEKLTTSGSEVDEVIDKVAEFDKIVVGKVESVSKHPNADRLSVCKVSDGNELFDVVCGAPNVAEGQKVAFAKVGSIIPNGKFQIKKAKIRGEKSTGMICAEDELGLSEDHSGIMVLAEEAVVGEPLSKVLKLDDVILDIAITPNRADSLSHIGIARDLAAIFNRELKKPQSDFDYKVVVKNNSAEVVIENTSGCPRYSAVIVKDVEVKESPEWLKEKLLSVGLRPINNIVDVTNFVLLEVGQPLHAFDLDKLVDKKIVVKNSFDLAKFTTLDSKERSMLHSDLMICDGEKPVAIAGVMGGENSEVTSSTKNILIESAYFNPSSVRKTAKHLGLSTDASYRFERGTDPNITLIAAIRAASIISEVSDGKIDSDVIDNYPEKVEKNKVSVRFERINRILGFDISKNQVVEILKGLQFEIVNSDEEKLTVKVPTFRHDIEREIDLVEEIVRIYGFDGIPPIEKISLSLKKKVDETDFENYLRDVFTSSGFNEVISNSLVSDDKTIDYDSSIKVLNPQSTEMSRLRTSLIPGLLLNISRNIKNKEDNLRFFELGQVFKLENEAITSFDDFLENQNLTVAITGNRTEKEWYRKESKFDFYDLIGVLNTITEKFGSSTLKHNILENDNEVFEFGFYKTFKNQILVQGGKLNSNLLSKFEIEKEVFLFELNVDVLKKISTSEKRFSSLLKFPKVYRDFGFVLDKGIKYNEVVKVIKESSSSLLKNVNLFDIFESESIGMDKKSLAFQLEYYDNEKTLTDEEIDKEFWKTIDTVKQKFNAELRG